MLGDGVSQLVRVDVIRARNAERLARVALNNAMGLPADTPTQIVDNLAYQPTTLDRAALQADALRFRPAYRQARLRAEAQESVVRRTFLDFFPDITGTGTYGGSRTDLLATWSATFNLTWSLFDGGNRIARYKEAKATLEANQARIRALEAPASAMASAMAFCASASESCTGKNSRMMAISSASCVASSARPASR